jgi:hypothetical protein
VKTEAPVHILVVLRIGRRWYGDVWIDTRARRVQIRVVVLHVAMALPLANTQVCGGGWQLE